MEAVPRLGWMSPEQWLFCSWRASGLSYQDIRARARENLYHIGCDETLCHCFVRTALGLNWHIGHEGGQDPYLCPDDAKSLCEEISDAANDLNCCPTSYVLELAYDLKIERAKFAVNFLANVLKCHRLAERIELQPMEPTRQWLQGFCRDNGLKIKCAEKIEGVRRSQCDRRKIYEWFLQYHQVLCSYPRQMILNMDETGISSNKRFKVVTPEGVFPVSPEDKQQVHITGIVTISACGKLFRPGIITPKLQNLPSELAEFAEDADFYSSKTGWMTKEVFKLWTVNICHEIQQWRLTLPEAIRSKRILLLLDGHGSRRNSEAMLYFRKFGIDILTFPGHATHILQAFDVGIASTLKCELQKQVQKWTRKLMEGIMVACSAVGTKRWILVNGFLEALRKSVTRRSATRAFMDTGLVPVNPDLAISNHLLMDDAVSSHDSDWINSRYFAQETDSLAILMQMEGRMTDVETMEMLTTQRDRMLTPCHSLITQITLAFDH